MKMVIRGVFGVAELDFEVKIFIRLMLSPTRVRNCRQNNVIFCLTVLFDLVTLFEVNRGIKFRKIDRDGVFIRAKVIERGN